jgi:hypothetical protein
VSPLKFSSRPVIHFMHDYEAENYVVYCRCTFSSQSAVDGPGCLCIYFNRSDKQYFSWVEVLLSCIRLYMGHSRFCSTTVVLDD